MKFKILDWIKELICATAFIICITPFIIFAFMFGLTVKSQNKQAIESYKYKEDYWY